MSLISPRSYRGSTPANWVDIPINIRTRNRGLMFTATGIGLASMVLLCLNDSGATLEPATQKMLFVNPTVGDESIGNGSESAPFKTITQALQVAQPNSVIVLCTGTYSTSSGETFPLILKPGVSIQGDPHTRGSNIIIQGGGTFLSPTFARQNITILGANQASLTGVTITNPNPRGYGLWIESSSPVVIDNTFTGNNHDGISITGNSAPTIRSNYFHENGANGMTIYGTSRAEVQENVFEKTGFGINIAQKAAPMLISNRITKNLDGIVVQAKAQPVLRGNVIENNTRDGVVAIATSQPDLGTKTEPGGNVFRQNGRYDINNSVSSLVILAFGNQLASTRTSGNINLAGTVSSVATNANQPPSNPRLAQKPQTSRINNPDAKSPTPSSLVGSGVEPTPNSATTTTSEIEIPVPPPGSTAQMPPIASSRPQPLSVLKISPNTPNQSEDSADGNTQVAPASGSDTAIEIPVPPITASKPVTLPPPKIGSTAQSLPVLQPAPIVVSDLLPVPGGNIPIGNTRNLPKVAMPATSLPASAGSPPPPPTRTTALGLRYRVVVEADSASKQALVRSLIPGAFRTFSKGRVLMQVGAFGDHDKADEMLQLVKSKGLRAAIEQLN